MLQTDESTLRLKAGFNVCDTKALLPPLPSIPSPLAPAATPFPAAAWGWEGVGGPVMSADRAGAERV